VILVVAALKGGVGKTTTTVYLAAVAAAARHEVTIIDADPQASAAEWLESVEEDDEWLGGVGLVEAPTDRLLARALSKIEPDEVAIVDSPPGQERMLERALELADVAVVPTRVGGVETARAEAVLALMPRKLPSGLVITSARTYTRDYMEAVQEWHEAGVPVWGTIPERVAIAHGPTGFLAEDGIESYRSVWRRALRAARS
jgi:chromosome partitioning protein